MARSTAAIIPYVDRRDTFIYDYSGRNLRCYCPALQVVKVPGYRRQSPGVFSQSFSGMGLGGCQTSRTPQTTIRTWTIEDENAMPVNRYIRNAQEQVDHDTSNVRKVPRDVQWA